MTRIVIMGGGPAGYEAALVAAQHGADVTVVENDGRVARACSTTACPPRRSSPPRGPACLRNAGELGIHSDCQATAVDCRWSTDG